MTYEHFEEYTRNNISVMDVIRAFGLDYCLANALMHILCHDNQGDMQQALRYVNKHLESKEIEKIAAMSMSHKLMRTLHLLNDRKKILEKLQQIDRVLQNLGEDDAPDV